MGTKMKMKTMKKRVFPIAKRRYIANFINVGRTSIDGAAGVAKTVNDNKAA